MIQGLIRSIEDNHGHKMAVTVEIPLGYPHWPEVPKFKNPAVQDFLDYLHEGLNGDIPENLEQCVKYIVDFMNDLSGNHTINEEDMKILSEYTDRYLAVDALKKNGDMARNLHLGKIVLCQDQ